MNLANLFKIAIRALLRNKMRASLTMLGIIIGVGSVIAMLAIGEGTKVRIRNEIMDMGSNSMMVMPNFQRRGGVSFDASGSMALKYSDVIAIRNEAANVVAVSPSVSTSGQVIFGNQNITTSVNGVSEEYLMTSKTEVESGRFFSSPEIKTMAKVCLLGPTVVKDLFGEGANPVGLTIRIKKIPFLVIGVLKKKGGSSMGQDQDNIILAPYSTIQRRLSSIDYINGIYASAISEDKSDAAKAEIELILRRTHKLKESEENDFTVMSQSQLLTTISTITDVLTYLLGAIAGISLLVGGIGIMNIMLVSVTERIREIGLRKSIGGRKRDILRQFLVESSLLSILGGLIGVLFGFLIGKGVCTVMGNPTVVKTQYIVLAFMVCLVIGVFFGWYPAKKAAGLNPIDALRYE
jgi:putative ABC transport system permease protein